MKSIPWLIALSSNVALGGTVLLTDCTSYAGVGARICICGSGFTTETANRIALDGQPLAVKIDSSQRLWAQLPANLTPGPHRVSVPRETGLLGDQNLIVHGIGLAPVLGQNELIPGQTITRGLEVLGLESPLAFRLRKVRGPVQVRGGAKKIWQSTGGARNVLEVPITARKAYAPRAPFEITPELIQPECPCSGKSARKSSVSLAIEPAPDPPQGVVARRVLVTVPDGAGITPNQVQRAVAGIRFRDRIPLTALGRTILRFDITDGSSVLEKTLSLRLAGFAGKPDALWTGAALSVTEGGAALHYERTAVRLDSSVVKAGGAGVRVALIDSGLDTKHRSLASAKIQTFAMTGVPNEPGIHGTFMAGVIVGDRETGPGAPGFAPAATLLSMPACHLSRTAQHTLCADSSIAEALDAAIREKAHVVNLSLVRPHHNLLAPAWSVLAAKVSGRNDMLWEDDVSDLIRLARQRGALVFAAAGNDGPAAPPLYPASLDDVTSVVAVRQNREVWQHSARGVHVDLAAPGVDIVSAIPGSWDRQSGTSISTAIASAVAALAQSSGSDIDPLLLLNSMMLTAVDIGAVGRDDIYGSGLIDAAALVQRLHYTGNARSR